MIRIKTNINKVIMLTIDQLNNLADTDILLRTCADEVRKSLTRRVYNNGIDAEGNPIGVYSKSYMVVRTGAYKNAGRVSRGKNVGKVKDAGVFTDKVIRLNKNTGVFSGDEKEGKPRPRYNRTSDTKVVASLTRQMEKDTVVVSIQKGYGIGFLNKHNYDKSQWVEATYKRKGKIFSLSAEEKNIIKQNVEKFVADALS